MCCGGALNCMVRHLMQVVYTICMKVLSKQKPIHMAAKILVWISLLNRPGMFGVDETDC